MEQQIRDEINRLGYSKVRQIIQDYGKGTKLTCWDLARKYNTKFSVICYIVKQG